MVPIFPSPQGTPNSCVFLITNNAPSSCDTPSHLPANLKNKEPQRNTQNQLIYRSCNYSSIKKKIQLPPNTSFFPNSLITTVDVSNKLLHNSLLKTQTRSSDSYKLPGKPAHSLQPSLRRQLMSLRKTDKSFSLFSNQRILTKLRKGKNFKLP